MFDPRFREIGRLLDHDEIHRLRAAVVSAHLTGSRQALLAHISAEFTATLPVSKVPGEQVLMDLDALNKAGTLIDGSVPLATWLKNAVPLCGGRQQAGVFSEALARIPTAMIMQSATVRTRYIPSTPESRETVTTTSTEAQAEQVGDAAQPLRGEHDNNDIRAASKHPYRQARNPMQGTEEMGGDRPPIDFLIFAPLEEERDAIVSKLENPEKLDSDGTDAHVYYEAVVRTRRRDGAVYRVIVVSPTEMGPIAAAITATTATSRWRPAHVIVVGIAGGLKDEVATGDVMVASAVADYTVGKVTDTGPREERWSMVSADPMLLAAARNFRTGWEGLVKEARPGKGAIERHVGIIATGGDVIASKAQIATYQKDMPKLIGVEMEGGGVATALHQHVLRPRFLMIRGVSDLADGKGNNATKKRWRAYARHVGAAYAIGLLHEGPVPASTQAGRPSGRAPASPPPPNERQERRSNTRPGAQPRVEDLATLKARIQEALQSSSNLGRALAEKLSLDEKDAESIVEALLDMSARDVASIFANLVRMLNQASLHRDRDVARVLLWQILPLLGDWRDIINNARERSAGAALELRLRTETVAEIILAGVDARSCLWAPGDEYPQGAYHVPLPAVARAPFFDADGKKLEQAVEAVFINLHTERAPRDDVWSKVKKRWPSYNAFKRVAKAEMDAEREDPFYMLVIDEEMDPEKKQDRDRSWRVVQETIGRALPGLRLVRLTGGDVELDGEIDMAPIIRKLRDT